MKVNYQELTKQGIIIIRSQYDPRKEMWKIVKMTHGQYSHGWSRFGANWYITQQDCDDKIDMICNHESNKCVTEAMAEAHYGDFINATPRHHGRPIMLILLLAISAMVFLGSCEKTGYDCVQNTIDKNGDTITSNFHLEAHNTKCIIINNDSITTVCGWYGD